MNLVWDSSWQPFGFGHEPTSACVCGSLTITYTNVRQKNAGWSVSFQIVVSSGCGLQNSFFLCMGLNVNWPVNEELLNPCSFVHLIQRTHGRSSVYTTMQTQGESFRFTKLVTVRKEKNIAVIYSYSVLRKAYFWLNPISKTQMFTIRVGIFMAISVLSLNFKRARVK